MKNYCVKIKYVAEQIRGVSYKPEDISDIKSDDHIPLLRANNIQKGQLCLKDLVYVDCKKVQKKQHILPNDILICASSGSKDLVGKAIKICTPGFTFGAFCKVLRPSGVVDPDYFSAFFQSERYKFNISNSAIGININNIRSEHLDDMSLPLPSKEEQRQKAKVINKLNEIIEKKQNQIFYLEQIIKSRFVEMFGDLISNSQNRKLVRLEELGKWSSGGTPPKSNKPYFEGSINWFTAGELNSLYLNDSIDKISEGAIYETSAKLFTKGSMLVGMYDTAAFKLGILSKDSSANQACACITPNSKVNILWLYAALIAIRPKVLNMRKGVRQKNLNLQMIKELRIPYVNLNEQNEYVKIFKRIYQSKLAVQKSIEQLEILKKSLMQEYFG
ncbi:restriction endonuclease subunit S [Succinatimonas hippei]|uniref:restriction endonuclease subunit S n=1 Tax=Succinatimonas hippei TaxID=626938 RepID=UPI0023F94EDE|nr:restriction endonuclease subunit S [Succinatimonas hippei]